MRNTLVLGNWKMNGSRSMLKELLLLLIREPLEAVQVGVLPPFVYLALARAFLKGSRVGLGAQTVSEHFEGAYTGEVSVAMLRELDCRYVLVGHSERREYYGETDGIVADKFAVIAEAGLTPVLCVGETKRERKEGQTESVVCRQLDVVRARVGNKAFARAVIAYEPVWAIGTGDSATPQQAQAVHEVIRRWVAQFDPETAVRLPVLYGGSMKEDNAEALLTMPDIDGGLVGGASIDSQAFLAICRVAREG